jgi:hypothetical protein
MMHLTRTASLTTTWNWLMMKLLAVKSIPEIIDRVTPEQNPVKSNESM